MKSLRIILNVFRKEGYHVHTKAYQLNMVGIRSKQTNSGAFDDRFAVFFKKPNGRWQYFEYPCTTDPGTYYLQNPIWSDTAILQQGQNLHAYGIGKHKGKPALVQMHQDVTVIRDYNRDAILDFQNGKTRTGRFAINIHRASMNGETKVIHKWSAGCQVLSRVDDFNHLMQLANQHRSQLGHNYFSYTLIDQRATHRARMRRTLGRTAIAAGLLGGGIALYSNFKNREA